jgi:hypothetical protein
MNAPFLSCATVTAISAFVSLGFSLVEVRNAAAAGRTVALYAAARSLALAIASAAAFALENAAWLEAVASCMVMVQACDTAIGVTTKDRRKTLGPAAIALLNAAALAWLLR